MPYGGVGAEFTAIILRTENHACVELMRQECGLPEARLTVPDFTISENRAVHAFIDSV